MGLADPHTVGVLMHHREFQGVDAPEIVRKPETAAQDCATARDPLLGQPPLLVRRIKLQAPTSSPRRRTHADAT